MQTHASQRHSIVAAIAQPTRADTSGGTLPETQRASIACRSTLFWVLPLGIILAGCTVTEGRDSAVFSSIQFDNTPCDELLAQR